jgi:hypothetical protein
MTTKPPLQKIPKGALHTDDTANKITRGWEVLNYKRRKDKKSERSTDLVAHNQTLKQQKQLNGRNHYIPINFNTECQWTTPSSKDTAWQTRFKRKTQQSVIYKKATLMTEINIGLE